MTRIIAGAFGGRRIAVPPRGTRPTTDRVREAVFSRLDAAGAVRGSRVLDLFAGSGALGLEALSRGADEAVFVDSSGPACKVVAANVAAMGVATRARVVRDRAEAFLGSSPQAFSLAFLDPPYDLPADALAAVVGALAARLDDDATVVLETASRTPAPVWPAGLAPEATKAYGSTTIHYVRRAPQL